MLFLLKISRNHSLSIYRDLPHSFFLLLHSTPLLYVVYSPIAHVWTFRNLQYFSITNSAAVNLVSIYFYIVGTIWKMYQSEITGTKDKWVCDIAQFSSVQSLSHVWLFATPWTAARQDSLSITNSRSSLRLTSIESVMPSSILILGHHFLLLPPIPPSIRVFSNESTHRMRWPKYWSFSPSIIPSIEIPGLISFRMD